MQIILYKSNAKDNELDKTNSLVEFLTLEGELRQETSIIKPNIMVQMIDYENVVESARTDIVDTDSIDVVVERENKLMQCNYCYIPSFKRYYYIDEIVSVNQHLWRLEMHTDVLMSFKEDIKNLKCFVLRNEYDYNDKIKDDMLSYYYDKEITETTMKSGIRANITFSPYQDTDKYCLAISVINNLNVKGSTIVEPPTNTNLPIVSSFVSGVTNMVHTYAMIKDALNDLSDKILDNDNLATYILSVVAFPFELETKDYIPLFIGKNSLGTTIVKELSNEASQYYVLSEFKIVGDSFLDYSPYTKYEFYFPYHSQWVEIEGDLILNKQLLVIYVIDYKTGMGQIILYNDTDKSIVYTCNAQIGIKIPINSTNFTEWSNNQTRNLTNSAITGVTGGIALGLGATALMGIAPIAMTPVVALGTTLGGLSTTTKGIADAFNNSNTNYQRGNGSVTNNNTSLYAPQNVIVRKTKLKPRNYNSDYFHLVGRPLNSIEKLSSLKGYTKVGSCNIDFENALEKEKTEIANILTDTGIYL